MTAGARAVLLYSLLPEWPRVASAQQLHAQLLERGERLTLRTVQRMLEDIPANLVRRRDAAKPYGWARSVPGAKEAAAPRSITTHAVSRYIERIRPGISRGRAHAELIEICKGAHAVKEIEPGIWLWRGPSPRRLRLRVDGRGYLVTVLTAHDGMRRHLQEEAAE